MQVLQRLPIILEAMIVPSEDEELVFLTRLLQVTPLTSYLSPLTSHLHPYAHVLRFLGNGCGDSSLYLTVTPLLLK